MLCTVSAVMCASLSPESLTASIDEVQKRFGAAAAAIGEKKLTNSVHSNVDSNENKITDSNEDKKAVTDDSDTKTKEKSRSDKMLDYYRYFAPPTPPAYPPAMPYMPYFNPYYQQPYMSAFYSPYYSGSFLEASPNAEEYDEEYTDSNDVETEAGDDDGSRANKRRPGASKNSPIFYIRLPPTPYMFVPGMGYISQPPTIQPLTPQYPPINPFINLPLTYLSNAKPTGVFPWNQPTSSNGAAYPQFPSYLPPRPQKPYRPKPQMSPAAQDSKITHLGSYLFNGRPENIFLMPPHYHNPYASPYHLPNPYQAGPPPMPPSPYNPYTPMYGPPALPNFY